MKLSQVLAIEKGIKNSTNTKISALHHKSAHAPLYEGLEKTYRPRDDEGDSLPAESQRIQLRASDVVNDAVEIWSEFFDITYAKDLANCTAKADVVVGESTVMSQVPVTYLLFLEKKLEDVVKFITELPTLDPSEEWTWDSASMAYSTKPVETHRSRKVTKPVVLYEATKEHPAQVKEVSEDVIVGFWSKIRYSAAFSAEAKSSHLSKATTLLRAVKVAREAANSSTNAERAKVGEAVFNFIFSTEE